MADENIVTNIVAKSDFSNLIADLNKVSFSLTKLQDQLIASNKMLASQVSVMNRSFAETLRSTGQFSTHFVSLSSDVDKFGTQLDKGQLKLGRFFQVYKQHAQTSGGLIRDLAKQQVQLQNAIMQPLGRNAEGLMQYNVHIPRGLDLVKNKTAIAKQELQILNKVIQEGGNQLINWGKNTQWAGRQLTVGLTVPLAAFGKAASDAFRMADQELVRLTKVYGGIAQTSAQELGKVRAEVTKTAADISKSYGVSFKDTISLAADIAATGKTGNELLGSIKETTRLSVLGEVDRQDAMKATLAIQTAFKQNTEQLSESINFLNAVENQTSTTLNDLVEAIPKAGPIIQGLGGDVKDLALYLTAMREGGINATEGANALKSGLASLINPTKVAKDMFSGFGISLTNIVEKNAGNTTATILELQAALETLNPLQKQQALEQLFGKFQFARMNALFENLGKQGSQTLAVMDLMKASSQDLANLAGRELAQVTESASGKYRRAVEGLRADLAGIGEQFLKINTSLINFVDGIIKFVQKLPDPIKQALGFMGMLTAAAGPLIMLTGVLGNFFGYIIKGAFHFKSLFKGGEGWKLLTPEILAAQKAGNLVEQTFYNDAAAANILKKAIHDLSLEFEILQQKALNGSVAVNPGIQTAAGNVVMNAGVPRVVNNKSKYLGKPGSRDFSHQNPTAGKTEEQKMAETIFAVTPGTKPVNQRISANPQIFAEGDLPTVQGLTRVGKVSTGVVAAEAAKWHSLMGTLSMMTEREVSQLKKEIATTGTFSSEISQTFAQLLGPMNNITNNAAKQSALIVRELQEQKITLDVARQRIIELNAQTETLMAQTTQAVAKSLGRTANITAIPLINQAVVNQEGKSNFKELFRKNRPASNALAKIASALGVKTWGGAYATETTMPKKFATGGRVFGGPRSDTTDTQFEYLPEGSFVLNRKASDALLGFNQGGMVPAMVTPGEILIENPDKQELDMLEAYNNQFAVGGRVIGTKNNYGIPNQQLIFQNIIRALTGKKTAIGSAKLVRTSSRGTQATGGATAISTPGAVTDEVIYSNYSRKKFYDTKLGKTLARLYGVGPTRRTPGSRSQSEAYIHVVHPEFLNQHGMPTGRASTPNMSGQDLISTGALGRIDPAKTYRVLPAMTIKGNKEFNELLTTGKASSANWNKISGGHLIDFAALLHSYGLPPRVINDILTRAANNINYGVVRLGSNIDEAAFARLVFDASEKSLVQSFNSRTSTFKHFNAGGTVGRNKNNYGIIGPAFKSQLFKRLGAGVSRSSSHGGYDVNSLTLGMGKKLFGGSGLSPKAQNLMYNYMVENLQGSSPDGYVKTAQGKMLRGFVPQQANSILFGAAMDVSRLPGISKKDREILSSWSSDPYKNNYSKGLLSKITGRMFGYNSGGVVGGRVRNGKYNYGVLDAKSNLQMRGYWPGSASSRLNYDSQGMLIPGPASRGLSPSSQMGLSMAGSMGGMAIGQSMGGGMGSMIGMIAGGFLPSLINKIKTLISTAGGFLNIVKSIGSFLRAWTLPTLIITTLALTVKKLLDVKKAAEEAGKANRLAFGGTEKSFASVGITKYKSLEDRLKAVNEQIDLNRAKAQSAYDQYTKGGPTGITLSIAELNKAIENAKNNQKEYVNAFNNIDSSRVVKYAADLKAQFVAIGLSASEASNQIYAIIKASDKAGQALSAVSSTDFKNIIDQTTALTRLFDNLGKASTIEGFNPEEFARGLDTLINSVLAYQQGLIGTKDAVDPTNIIDAAEALKITMEKIGKISSANAQLSSDQINKLKEQDVIYASILGNLESTASITAKILLYNNELASVINLSAMSGNDAIDLAKNLSTIQQGLNSITEDQSSKNPLAFLAEPIKNATNAVKNYATTIKEAQKQDSEYYSKKIKAIELEIKKINEAADARRKALQEQQDASDFDLEVKKKQLEYQDALATGNMAAAAQAQLDIRQLTKQKEVQDAITAIEDKRKADLEVQNQAKQDAQDKQDAFDKRIQTSMAKSAETTANLTKLQSIRDEIERLSIIGRTPGANKEDIKKQIANILLGLKSGTKDEQKMYSEYQNTYGYTGNVYNQNDPMAMASNLLSAINSSMTTKGLSDTVFQSAVSKFDEAVNKFAGQTKTGTGTKENPVVVTKDYGYSSTTTDGRIKATQLIKDFKLKAKQYVVYNGITYEVGTNDILSPVKKAMGGRVAAGREYRVGERGEEIFRPDTSGTIYPNPKTAPSYAGMNPTAMGASWLGNTLSKAGNSVIKNILGFDLTKPFSKKSNMEKLSMALLPLGGEGLATKGAAKVLSADTIASIGKSNNFIKEYEQTLLDLKSGKYFKDNPWLNVADKEIFIDRYQSLIKNTLDRVEKSKQTDVPADLFSALDEYIQKPLSGLWSNFDTIATATSRSLINSNNPYYRALSVHDMAKIAGYKEFPSASMKHGLDFLKEHGYPTMEPARWAGAGGFGNPGDMGLKIGESWIPNVHKAITENLEWAKNIAVYGGTGGGANKAIAKFIFDSNARGIKSLSGIANAAGSWQFENATEGLIAPWSKYILTAINRGKHHITDSKEGMSHLIDEYVFKVGGQSIKDIPKDWKPFGKLTQEEWHKLYNIPKFKNGINSVPVDMLAQLHANEAVIPANMNPFNPNANNATMGNTYNFAPVIHAAPGMDVKELGDVIIKRFETSVGLKNKAVGPTKVIGGI